MVLVLINPRSCGVNKPLICKQMTYYVNKYGGGLITSLSRGVNKPLIYKQMTYYINKHGGGYYFE